MNKINKLNAQTHMTVKHIENNSTAAEVMISLGEADAINKVHRDSLKPAPAAYVHNPKVTNKLLTIEADKAHKLPKLGAKDKAKCKGIILAIRSARQSADHHLANSLHHVRSAGDWVRKDRIAALTNAIDKFSRLNDKVLTGGAKVKAELIKQAWLAYADLELHGSDNAHYQETHIPMDERMDIADDGCNGTTGFINEAYDYRQRYMAS